MTAYASPCPPICSHARGRVADRQMTTSARGMPESVQSPDRPLSTPAPGMQDVSMRDAISGLGHAARDTEQLAQGWGWTARSSCHSTSLPHWTVASKASPLGGGVPQLVLARMAIVTGAADGVKAQRATEETWATAVAGRQLGSGGTMSQRHGQTDTLLSWDLFSRSRLVLSRAV